MANKEDSVLENISDVASSVVDFWGSTYSRFGQGIVNTFSEEGAGGVLLDLIGPGFYTQLISAAYDEFKERIENSQKDDVENNIQEIIKNSQTLLTLNYDYLKNFLNKRIREEDLPFKSFGTIVSDPTKIMNNFVRPDDFKDFLNITPNTLAKLIPTVRLFKTTYDNVGNELNNFEIRFDEFLQDPTSILENKLSRGTGIGLQSFDWSYKGANPFESTRVIEANLKIRLSSAEDLDREYILTANDGETIRFKLIDLVVPHVADGEDEYEPNALAYKAVVGYSPNFTPETEQEVEIKRQLEILRRTLLLTRTSHDLEFRQNGTVILSLGFQARIDTAFETPQNDILGLFGTNIKKIENIINDLRKDLEKLKTNCGNDTTEYETLKRIFSEQEQKLVKNKEQTYKRLLDVLMSTNRVYTVDIPLEAVGVKKDEKTGNYKIIKTTELQENLNTLIGNFGKNNVQIRKFSGPVRRQLIGKGSNVEQKAASLREDQEKQITECIIDGGDTFEVPFIFFGDLIEAALIPFTLIDNPYNKDLRIFLGTGIIKDSNNTKITYNMSHVPISIDLFMDWFIETIYKPQKSFYFLKSFLVDASNGLLGEALKTEHLGPQAPVFSRNIITTTLELPPDIAYKNEINLEEEKINIHSATLIKNNVSCYFVSSRNNFGVSKKDEMPNLKNGVDRGLVKKIDYKRTELPGKREIAMNHTESDTLSRISEPYKATISMIGNNLFYPGQTIYVEPSPAFPGGAIKGSGGESLKIRGVYFIINVDNYIEQGKFETTVLATWIGSGDDTNNNILIGSLKSENCNSQKLTDQIRSKFQQLDQDIIVDSGNNREIQNLGKSRGGGVGSNW